MDINSYLDSTYLKTLEQSGLSEEQTIQKIFYLTQEAIAHKIFAVMIRPNYVKKVRKFLEDNRSKVILGTVIGFHEGTNAVEDKLSEAKKAIEDGADELDFVINYEAYKNGEIDLVKNEFLQCTQLCIENNKVAKWIIEIAALNDNQIADLTSKIRTWSEENFAENQLNKIFVKSSTGFYQTEGGKPNGATFEGIKIMLENAGKLPVKAAGGVRTKQDAEKMIEMGVKRIGTSSARDLIQNKDNQNGY